MTIHSAFENYNFNEILNCYTLWIIENPQHLRRGAKEIKKPISQMLNPNGMRAFLQVHAPENTWESWETPISNHLSKNPEEVKQKADIFSKTFPGVIKDKIRKKKEKEIQSEKAIEAHLQENNKIQSYIQENINFDDKKFDKNNPSKQDNIANMIKMLSSQGAKSIKTPDGWEIQF